MSQRTEKVLISLSYFLLIGFFFAFLGQAKTINSQDVSYQTLVKSFLVLILILLVHLAGGLLGLRYFKLNKEETPNQKLTKLIFVVMGLHGLYFMVFGKICEKIDQITNPNL